MIVGYFGVPGCGKTTLAAKKARTINKQIARGKKRELKGKKNKCPYDFVLTNFECKDCYKVDFTDIGKYDMQRCAIILDELTIDADNRDFKNFARSSVEGFIYHRHYFNDIFYYTQNYQAVDKKIRDLTHTLYFVRKSQLPFFNLFTRARIIYRTIEINDMTKDIVNGYRFPNWFEIFLNFIGVLKLGEVCFRPFYYKDFDSFSQPLKLAPFIYKKWF